MQEYEMAPTVKRRGPRLPSQSAGSSTAIRKMIVSSILIQFFAMLMIILGSLVDGLILTNFSGFYRYRIRDSVRVVGRYRNTPTVQFVGRIDQTISIMGEKTTDAALNDAVCALSAKTKIDVVDFSVFPDLDSEPVRYIIFLEIAANPVGIRPKEVWRILEAELARANPSMGDKMKSGTCGHVRVQFLEPQAFALYQDLMLARGGNSGQVKPPHIVVNEFQRKFLFGLTDYMYEYVR